MRSLYPWLKLLGWCLVGGLFGYVFPLLLAFGALPEFISPGSESVTFLGITVAKGVTPSLLGASMVGWTVVAGGIAAWYMKPWRAPKGDQPT
ncbi:MAG: hypothetical protein GF320_07400 [Armatimonadia bacterium]|nr:hypothetical protein [Armatimonadia bacterium]